MDITVIIYLLFTVTVIGCIALYINKPHLFQIVYFTWSRTTKWLFAFACGFLPYVLNGIPLNIMGLLTAVIIGVALEKHQRLAYIKPRF